MLSVFTSNNRLAESGWIFRENKCDITFVSIHPVSASAHLSSTSENTQRPQDVRGVGPGKGEVRNGKSRCHTSHVAFWPRSAALSAHWALRSPGGIDSRSFVSYGLFPAISSNKAARQRPKGDVVSRWFLRFAQQIRVHTRDRARA